MNEEGISAKLDYLIGAIENIRRDGATSKEELKQEIRTETRTVLEKLGQNESRINYLAEKNKQLENRLLTGERIRRKNNILIFGIEVPSETDLLSFTIDRLETLLGIQIRETDINNIYQLKGSGIPPIKIEFVRFLKKLEVVGRRANLKNTRVFIADDLCPEDREDHKLLAEHLKLARSKKYSAKIKGRTLEINGEIYTIEQIRSMKVTQVDELSDNTRNTVVRRSCSFPDLSSRVAVTENSDVELPVEEESRKVDGVKKIGEERRATVHKSATRSNTAKSQRASPALGCTGEQTGRIHRTNSAGSTGSDTSTRLRKGKLI